jgi:hypothetical protein
MTSRLLDVATRVLCETRSMTLHVLGLLRHHIGARADKGVALALKLCDLLLKRRSNALRPRALFATTNPV